MRVLEAIDLDDTKKFNFLISNGVFHYFELNYARKVMLKMISALNPKKGGAY